MEMEKRPAGESAKHQPSQRDRPRLRQARRKRPSPNEWAENRSPAQSNQRAERKRSQHQKRIGHQHRTPKDGIGATLSSWPSGPALGWKGSEPDSVLSRG